MKKISLFFLLIISLFTFASITYVNAEDTVTEISGARFKVESITESNELPYGVNHTKVNGMTSTSIAGYDADGYGGKTDTVQVGEYYPQQVNVLEVPSSQNVRITSWANLNNHKWTLTTVKGLISDYHAKNPGWKVIAAINGDFFDIGAKGNLPYQTSGAVVSNGEFYKTTSGGTVGFTNDGSANSLIGNEKVERTQYMKLAVYNENDEIIKEFDIENINQAPNANETAVYFANYNSEKDIVPVEVNVGTSNGYFVDEADMALPNKPTDFYGKGTITSTESKTISRGQFAIVTNNSEVNEALAVGVKIRTQFEYIGAYANANDVTGGGSTIMKDGVVNPDGGLNDRAPRTVIGRKADGTIVMMVVDGRQSIKNMYGADRTELAAIMANYGAVDAYNLDGGGSSTMVIRQDGDYVVMNSPSDGRERTDANCLLIVVKDPELNTNVIETTTNAVTLGIDVTNNNTHDITEMVVEMNNETKTVANGQVTFDNLEINTEYAYKLFYRNSNNELVRIVEDGKIKTLKRAPEFIKLEIHETKDFFDIRIVYNDPDNASSLKSAAIGINGFNTFLWQGKVVLKKSIIGYEISALSVSYDYNLNDGEIVKVTVDNPTVVSTTTIDVYFLNIILTQADLIDEIYK